MTTISDLPDDVAGEILSRIPLTSLRTVRSTCKKWDALSKYQSFGKAAARKKQFLGFMMIGFRVCSVKFDLRGIRNHNDFVDPSIKQIEILNQVKISKLFHCDGLLLCIIKDDNQRLAVWNPYLGQIRWIQPRSKFHRSDMYAFGYDNNSNHKILRFLDVYQTNHVESRRVLLFWFEIFDFSSNSWRVLDVKPHWNIKSYHSSGVSLKGNTYFPAQEKIKDGEIVEDFLICFDFTTERFRPHLPMPYRSYSRPSDSVTLSSVRDEQLAVLYQPNKPLGIMEIWLTTTIEPNGVSWTKFLKVSMTPLNGFPDDFADKFEAGSFFIDEENKIVVVSDAYGYEPSETTYIIGEDGCFKPVTLRKPQEFRYYYDAVRFSSYVPSLVQLQTKQPGKRKERDY